MPKMKTKSAFKKRFKVTKGGKVLCSHPGRGHQHALYPGSTNRMLRKRMVLADGQAKLIRRAMGG